MKKLFLMVGLLIFLLPAIGAAAGWSGNVNGFIGGKALNENDWEPLEDQGEFGVRFDFAPAGDYPVNIAIDLLASGREKTYYEPLFAEVVEVESATSELAFGVRKYFGPAKSLVKPYFGVGLAIISARMEAYNGSFTREDDDSGGGFWAGGGVLWSFHHINVGFNLRYSRADVTLFGQERKAGGYHSGLLVGYHW